MNQESWKDTYSPWGCKELDMTDAQNNGNKNIKKKTLKKKLIVSFSL